MDFSEILHESELADSVSFINVLKEATETLSGKNAASSNITLTGGLVNLKPEGEALVIGDLHGDLSSLSVILKKSDFLKKMAADKSATLVFLGDYGDRGVKSPELYYVVLRLKIAFPSQVVLLRGNHEGPSDLMASPHDLPIYLQRKFKEKWVPVYQRLRELFSYFYLAVYVEERYLMVHGGLPARLRSLQEIADAKELHPAKPFFEELLWNDPDEQVRDVFPSPRGAGNLFGKDVTKEVLRRLNAKILIRGHEFASGGFKINHDGRVLTLFSRRGSPYYNRVGAFLELPLAGRFENANQLLPYIHTF